MSYITKNGPPKRAVLPFKLPYNLERQPKRHLHVPLCTNIRAGDLTKVAITVDYRKAATPVSDAVGAVDTVRLTSAERQNAIHVPAADKHIGRAVHVPEVLLPLAERKIVVERSRQVVADVPCGAGIRGRIVSRIDRSEIAGTAERGAAVRQRVAPHIRR